MNFWLALVDSHAEQIVTAICITAKTCNLASKCGMACCRSAKNLFFWKKKVSGARCSRTCSRGVKSLSFSSAAACRATLQSESASFLPVTHITATIWVKCEFGSASGTHRCVPHNWTVDTLMAVPNILLVPAVILYTIPTYQIPWKSQLIQQQFWEIPNLAFVAVS